MIAATRQADLRHRFHLQGKPWHQQQVSAVLPPPPGPLCDHRQLATARTLVVRRDAGLGDCLMILPTLAALKRHYPHLQLIFQAPPAYTELLTGFAMVDEALSLQARPEVSAPDVVTVDLSNYMERHPLTWSVPRIDLLATAFNIQSVPHAAYYEASAGLQYAAQQWLTEQECSGRPLLGIALRGIYGHRSWLVPYVFELAGRFAAGYGDVIIFGADRQAPRCPASDNSGAVGTVASAYGLKLSLVAALLAKCDVAVVPDTGLLHLAACVRTPFVAIFGAVPPQLRLNYYQNYRCLTAADTVSCVPCCEGPQHLRCQYECLYAITPGQVMGAVEELLAAKADTNTRAEKRFAEGTA